MDTLNMKYAATIFVMLIFLASCQDNPVAPMEEPSAGMGEPSAGMGEPSAGMEEPSAGMRKPSARATKNASAQAKSLATRFENELVQELFDTAYDELLAMNPQRQTRLGIHENDDKWTDPSFEHALARVELMEKHLESIENAVDIDKLNSQNRISFDLFKYNTNRARRGLDFWWHQYPINQMFGIQSTLPAFLINSHPGRNVTDLENYIKRLQGIEAYMDQVIKILQDQEERGITPPNFVYDHALNDCKNILTGAPFDASDTDSPLLKDFQEKVRHLELVTTKEERLIQAARKTLIEHTGPAYRKLQDYLKSARERTEGNHGVWHLPNGEDWYTYSLKRNTTTDYSPEKIHSLGLSEVERIHDEIRGIMRQVGFEGSLHEFFAFTRTDDQFFVEDTEAGRQAYLDLAIDYISDMRKTLPEMVNTMPRFDLEVKAVEPYREKSAGKAFYSSPSPNGERPGIFYVNLYDVESVPTYELEALAYHEGIPGHHLQSAITLELKHLPRFRRYGHYTAYSEGWGLYAEYFPKEFGFYEDPWSDFGRLALELERAVRLVVDTGIHHKRWTREQAITYFEENTPDSRNQAVKAVERYMVMPGQATAYKIGMNRILELREKSKKALGDDFDLAEFHDVILQSGPLPLSLVEQKVNAWLQGP